MKPYVPEKKQWKSKEKGFKVPKENRLGSNWKKT